MKANSPPRDIDQIIKRIKTALPEVQVTQLQVVHPGADDDGLWFVKIPGPDGEVQVESVPVAVSQLDLEVTGKKIVYIRYGNEVKNLLFSGLSEDSLMSL